MRNTDVKSEVKCILTQVWVPFNCVRPDDAGESGMMTVVPRDTMTVSMTFQVCEYAPSHSRHPPFPPLENSSLTIQEIDVHGCGTHGQSIGNLLWRMEKHGEWV